MARTLKITLAYDGTDFSGWQVQPELATIQGTLASAIGRLTGENVLPQGSGRTDAGVHAVAQVASFSTESPIPVENFAKALNDMLPAAIRVLEVRETAPEFHARKSARAKTYRYRIFREPVCPPFLARYVWHFPYPLDEVAMAQAACEVACGFNYTGWGPPSNGPFTGPSANWYGFSSSHTGIVQFAMGDASVQKISTNIDFSTFVYLSGFQDGIVVQW